LFTGSKPTALSRHFNLLFAFILLLIVPWLKENLVVREPKVLAVLSGHRYRQIAADRIVEHYERHAPAWDADRRMAGWMTNLGMIASSPLCRGEQAFSIWVVVQVFRVAQHMACRAVK